MIHDNQEELILEITADVNKDITSNTMVPTGRYMSGELDGVADFIPEWWARRWKEFIC